MSLHRSRHTLLVMLATSTLLGACSSEPDEELTQDMTSPDLSDMPLDLEQAHDQSTPAQLAFSYAVTEDTGLPESLSPAQLPAQVTVRLRNTGETTWSPEDTALVMLSENTLLVDVQGEEGTCNDEKSCVVQIPYEVSPGREVTLKLSLDARLATLPAGGVMTFGFTLQSARSGRALQKSLFTILLCEEGEVCALPDDMAPVQDMDDMGEVEDMPADLDMMDMSPEEMDMPPAERVYCQVNLDGPLRDCDAGAIPSPQSCPDSLASMSVGEYVELLMERPDGWSKVRHLPSNYTGWTEHASLDCPVVAPDDPCGELLPTATRIANCQHPLLQPAMRPTRSSDLLYYVNRIYSIDKCFPYMPSPGSENGFSSYMEPAMRQVCLNYPNVTIINIPSAHTDGNSRQLRQMAWESDAPLTPMLTHDGKGVGHMGKVGFKAMFDAAWEERGYTYRIISAFRSIEYQHSLFQSYVQREGGDASLAAVYSAEPSHSEHQLGTTVDLTFVSQSGTAFDPYGNPTAFMNSPQGVWLRENAHRFGIVTTYQPQHVEQHQYQAEPWHMRFVGVEAADAMIQCDLSTEEFLNHRYQIGPLPRFEHMDNVYDRMRRLGFTVCPANPQ